MLALLVTLSQVSCNLGEKDLAARVAEVRAVVAESVTEVVRQPGQVQMAVRVEAVPKVMALVLAERRCCTGMRFVWTISDAQTPVYLEVFADAATLDMVFGG